MYESPATGGEGADERAPHLMILFAAHSAAFKGGGSTGAGLRGAGGDVEVRRGTDREGARGKAMIRGSQRSGKRGQRL